MIGGDVPFYMKIWQILTHPLQKLNFGHCVLERPMVFEKVIAKLKSGLKSIFLSHNVDGILSHL